MVHLCHKIKEQICLFFSFFLKPQEEQCCLNERAARVIFGSDVQLDHKTEVRHSYSAISLHFVLLEKSWLRERFVTREFVTSRLL